MNNKSDYNVLFVDCFDTILYRKISKKQIFKNWTEALSKNVLIDSKTLLKTYIRTNFWLCFKKVFKKFLLQEEFEVVIKKMYEKLAKKHQMISLDKFMEIAINLYIKEEQKWLGVNYELLDFLKKEKQKGKKIYLVSDFYCSSTILKLWIKNLKIDDIFDDVFSSASLEKEKANTKMYKHLLKMLDLNKKEVLMMGNNFWSDVLMARFCGLKTKHIKRNRKNANYNK